MKKYQKTNYYNIVIYKLILKKYIKSIGKKK